MGVRTWIEGWPVYRQVTGSDPLGRGSAVRSSRTDSLRPRVAGTVAFARSALFSAP